MHVDVALKEFLDSLSNETTRTNYGVALRDFTESLRHVGQITTEYIQKFRRKIQDKSVPTIAARLSAVKSFCDFCWTKGWISEDPSLGIRQDSVPRYANAKNIEFDDFKKLMNSIDVNKSLMGLRDFVLLRLIFVYGDVQKILNLKWTDPIPDKFSNTVDMYKKLMKEKLVGVYLEAGYLFFSLDADNNKKGLSLSGLRRILSTRTAKAGFPEKHFDFEAFKRLRAKQIYEQTKSIDAVRTFCGHKNISATKEFLKTLNVEL